MTEPERDTSAAKSWPIGRLLGRPRSRVAAALTIFFGFYLFIGFTGGEAFPFSTFPMYSVARLDPYVVPTQQILAYGKDGREYAVTDQSVRGRVRALRREIVLEEIDADTIVALADELVRSINTRTLTPEPVVGVRVMEQRVQLRRITDDADPLDPLVISAEVLIDTAPTDAQFSAEALPFDTTETAP